MLVSGQSTSVQISFWWGILSVRETDIVFRCRFFALWRLKRRRMSVDRTLNSSLIPRYASRFPTVLPRLVRPSSHIVRLHSKPYRGWGPRSILVWTTPFWAWSPLSFVYDACNIWKHAPSVCIRRRTSVHDCSVQGCVNV